MKVHSRAANLVVFSVFFLVTTVSALSFNRQEAGSNSFKDLVFQTRYYAPYGPDLQSSPPQSSTDGEAWRGYGFGMGAAEHMAYDWREGYLYLQVETFPHLSITDWSSADPLNPTLTPYSMDLSEFDSEVKDIRVCPEQGWLFVVLPDADVVHMYSVTKRDDPKTPTLLRSIEAGPAPDNIMVNADCSILAVANENDGGPFAEGAIHLVTGLHPDESLVIRKVALTGFTDEYLLERGVHMPLTENAMEYWDDFSNLRDDIDWSELRANYSPALFFQPEKMAFTEDSATLVINLQKNSALVRIDVAKAEAEVMEGYGLKEFSSASGSSIDIVKDDGCGLFVNSDVLFATRATDGIDTVEIDGTFYVLTADEGSDADFGAYEEKIDSADLFLGTTVTARNMVADSSFFDTNSSAVGASANFNSDCEDNGLAWCSNLEISLGSSAVDYSNPAAPRIQRVVAFGGRGISIFRVPGAYSEPISLVWDSSDDFEREGCAAFPWSHNGVQDEDFAPINGARYELLPEEREGLDDVNDPTQDGCDDAGNGQPGACPISQTVDEKAEEDGLAPESVTVAVACDRVLAVSCGENNGDCLMYDITDIPSGTTPELVKVFQLSPASETKSPGVAYDDRTLGELDAEDPVFLNACQSPTGKSGIMFNGAHSGTVSFWEFECTTPEAACNGASTIQGSGANAGNGSSGSSLSGGAIAGIVIGSLVAVALVAFVAMKASSRSNVEMDTGKSDNGMEEPTSHTA